MKLFRVIDIFVVQGRGPVLIANAETFPRSLEVGERIELRWDGGHAVSTEIRGINSFLGTSDQSKVVGIDTGLTVDSKVPRGAEAWSLETVD
jgi:hypothetical protein